MASTTKIMTAIVALEYGNLDDIVTIPPEASGIEGSSIWLSIGEEQRLEDLLYGLMLRSGNDAAMAIALHISGSVEDFSLLMNKTAKRIGANKSNLLIHMAYMMRITILLPMILHLSHHMALGILTLGI